MSEVSKGEGRTVLFVSHNLAAVKTLCHKAILLANGTTKFNGTQIEAINKYQLGQNAKSVFQHKGALETAPGNDAIRILHFEVKPISGDVIQISSGIQFELTFYNFKADINLDVTFELSNLDDVAVYHGGKIVSSQKDSKSGMYKVTGFFPPNLLNAGNYKFKVIFGENQRIALYVQEDVLQFEILNETIGSNSFLLPGIIRPNIEYTSHLIS